jgi:hypothetical protein
MMLPERNVKMFLIPRQHVGKLLHAGMSFRSNAYLPHDAVIETVSVDHQMDCLVILASHPSFPSTPINEYPPAAAIGFEVMPDDPALPRMEIARWDGTYAERTRV